MNYKEMYFPTYIMSVVQLTLRHYNCIYKE